VFHSPYKIQLMDNTGHAYVATAMKYQHPELELACQATNAWHTLHDKYNV